MANAELKAKLKDASVKDFLNAVEDEGETRGLLPGSRADEQAERR
jgi:hypothetical protein